MYLGDNVYYLAHPLTTCGTIEENLEDEQRIADKIEECFKSAVLTRPLTLIPITLTSEEAMPICKQMIDLCDAVIMTGDWQKSEGLKCRCIGAMTLNDYILKTNRSFAYQ